MVSNNVNRYTLVAMAPTGEACLVADDVDRVWVSSIYSPVEQVDASEIDRIIVEHDWIRVDRGFATWPELESYRNQHARTPPTTFPDLADYDADEVRGVLDETATADSIEEREAARLLLLDILDKCPVVFENAELRTSLIKRLRELTSAENACPPPLESPAITEARARYMLPAAA